MAQVVTGIAGAVVGGIIGGPTGALYGAQLGLTLGGYFFAEDQVIPGPKIGEISAQTSQEGIPRPIVWGKFRPIGGNVIATTAPDVRIKRTKKKSGKGGGGSTTVKSEEVYRTYAIGICEGPIDGIRRVWRNGDIVYDAASTDPNQIENNESFLDIITFYLGTFTQMPDPVLQAAFGAENVPAFRGTAYMVVDDENLTKLGGAIPTYMFETGSATKPCVPDISTLWWDKRDTLSPSTNNKDIYFRPDGLMMWGLHSTSPAKVKEYNLFDNYNVGGNIEATGVTFNVSGQTTNPVAFCFSFDGLHFYVADGTTNDIYQYDMTSVWDISTASYSGKSYNAGNPASFGTIRSMKFNLQTRFHAAFANGVRQYYLGTGWDISTTSYFGAYLNTTAQHADMRGLHYTADRKQTWLVSGSSPRTLFKYNMTNTSDPGDLLDAVYSGESIAVNTYVGSNPNGIFVSQNTEPHYLFVVAVNGIVNQFTVECEDYVVPSRDISWTKTIPIYSSEFSSDNRQARVRYLNGLFISCVAWYSNYPGPALLTCVNPATDSWTPVSVSGLPTGDSVGFSEEYGFRDAAYGAGKYVAVGVGGAIAYSTTAASGSWTVVASPWGTDETITCIIFAGGQFVIGGDLGSVATSPDGAAWTDRTAGSQFAGSVQATGITHDGTRYLMCGGSGSNIPWIQDSTDGITWNLDYDLYWGGYMKGIAYAADTDTYMAIDGTSVGETWAAYGYANLAAGNWVRCFEWGNNYGFDITYVPEHTLWATTGDDNFSYFSSDNGKTWYGYDGYQPPDYIYNPDRDLVFPDNSQPHTSVTYGNGLLVVSSWYMGIGVGIVPAAGAAGQPVYLPDLVADINERAGLPSSLYDVSLLPNVEVIGFSANNSKPAFTFQKALSDLYFFDPAMYDGILHFIPRGGSSVMTISEDDILEDSSDEVQNRNVTPIPRVMHLNYYDIAGGIDPNKQTSDRSIFIRGENEASLTTTVVMDANTAAKAISIIHKIAADAAEGMRSLEIPDTYLELTSSDIVTYKGRRMRIDSVEIDDGFQRIEMAFERGPAGYTSEAVGVAPPALPAVIPTSPGPTFPEFIDAHILDSEDDSALGFYFAISGNRSAWHGAEIEMSIDGGNTWIESDSSETDTVIGTLSTLLPAHSPHYPDDINVIQVEMITNAVDISSVTLPEMCNRENRAIIGNEIVNLGVATQISETIWEFSYNLRGRLGTDSVEHPIGERFVLLIDGRYLYTPIELYNLNQELYFRATSYDSSNQTIINETFTGKSHYERAPAALRAYRSGGNIIISCVGVGRKGARNAIQMSNYFTGYRFTINDSDVYDEAVPTKTITDPGGSVNIKAQQVNSLTGAGAIAEITI